MVVQSEVEKQQATTSSVFDATFPCGKTNIDRRHLSTAASKLQEILRYAVNCPKWEGSDDKER